MVAALNQVALDERADIARVVDAGILADPAARRASSCRRPDPRRRSPAPTTSAPVTINLLLCYK
jgi:hypothetical protein